jgi:hypothetical protein
MIVNLLHLILRYSLSVSNNSYRFNIKYALMDKAVDTGYSIEVNYFSLTLGLTFTMLYQTKFQKMPKIATYCFSNLGSTKESLA